MAKLQLRGVVVSNKMAKTLVVLVGRIKKHKKYKRRYATQKKYKAQADEQTYNLGDVVIIEECSPISKEKKWKVIKKVSSAAEGEAEEVPEDESVQTSEQKEQKA